jgi:site-specific DNA recombinase
VKRIVGQTPSFARRCAIYTRKSSEEGLEQGFNSLHAQREACEAYVLSQAGEGWGALQGAYDDGGVSGGTMDRPGLQQLLADVDAERIDIVVVYKVDRLTRSLADFAKIVERFDAKGVSFVSVTQAFNTITSMGRLTLNILLSFAQFEREVTGERIRDKIAASKKKGMWMGGVAPFGYDPPADGDLRALVVNPVEADQVRAMFRRYLELRSVHALHVGLRTEGVMSKRWVTAAGKPRGGQPFSRGALFKILRNRTYVGEMVHKGERFPGRHTAIVSSELFDQVQTQLDANAPEYDRSRRTSVKAPLTGLLLDTAGRPMSPSTGYGKNKRRYRYYACSAPKEGAKRDVGHLKGVTRAPAPALEALILERLQRLTLKPELDWNEGLGALRLVQLRADTIELLLDPAALDFEPPDLLLGRLPDGDRLTQVDAGLLLTLPVRPILRGGRTWFVTPDGRLGSAKAQVEPALIKALWRAHGELKRMKAGPLTPMDELTQAEGVPDSYLRRYSPLAFLAPDIQRAILDGRQPAGLTLEQLLNQDLPLAWADQRESLGFPAAV